MQKRKYGGLFYEEKQKINEIIDEIVTKQTASEILDYTITLDSPLLEDIQDQLKAIASFEMSDSEGKKDEAMDLLIKHICK